MYEVVRVAPANRHVAGAEKLAQLVADEIDDRLEVELRRHALLDAVDDRKLGATLLGLAKQPLRLVELMHVADCDRRLVGERLDDRDLGVAEELRLGAANAD